MKTGFFSSIGRLKTSTCYCSLVSLIWLVLIISVKRNRYSNTDRLLLLCSSIMPIAVVSMPILSKEKHGLMCNSRETDHLIVKRQQLPHRFAPEEMGGCSEWIEQQKTIAPPRCWVWWHRARQVTVVMWPPTPVTERAEVAMVQGEQALQAQLVAGQRSGLRWQQAAGSPPHLQAFLFSQHPTLTPTSVRETINS